MKTKEKAAPKRVAVLKGVAIKSIRTARGFEPQAEYTGDPVSAGDSVKFTAKNGVTYAGVCASCVTSGDTQLIAFTAPLTAAK